MLYVGLGDGGSEGDPDHVGQNLGVLLSKILRIDPVARAGSPYAVPADNPFVGRSGVRPETGVNWGWSAREGFHPFRGAAPAGARDPLLEMSHADGNCAVVGGYVYRGHAIPALDGVYLFGDDCRPEIVGVAVASGHVVAQRDLGPTVSQITTFGEDTAGELYVASRSGTASRLTAG